MLLTEESSSCASLTDFSIISPIPVANAVPVCAVDHADIISVIPMFLP